MPFRDHINIFWIFIHDENMYFNTRPLIFYNLCKAKHKINQKFYIYTANSIMFNDLIFCSMNLGCLYIYSERSKSWNKKFQLQFPVSVVYQITSFSLKQYLAYQNNPNSMVWLKYRSWNVIELNKTHCSHCLI